MEAMTYICHPYLVSFSFYAIPKIRRIFYLLVSTYFLPSHERDMSKMDYVNDYYNNNNDIIYKGVHD